MPSVASGQTTATSFAEAPGSTHTFAHDSGSGGANRCLIVRVAWNQSFGRAVTGVTYNGNSMTSVGAAASLNAMRVESFYLVAPDTGSNTVSIAISGSGDVSVFADATTFDDVDQTTPTTGRATATGNSTTPSVDVTSTASDDLVLDNPLGAGDSSPVTPGSGQTETSDHDSGGASIPGTHAASHEAGSGGTVTMDWTGFPSSNWLTEGYRLQHTGGIEVNLPLVTATGSVIEAGVGIALPLVTAAATAGGSLGTLHSLDVVTATATAVSLGRGVGLPVIAGVSVVINLLSEGTPGSGDSRRARAPLSMNDISWPW